MTGQSIFVAGATGVIGRRVVPLLVTAGHRVTAVGRTAEKRALLERAGAGALDVDLFDPTAVSRAVTDHEVVINLATHIPPSARVFVPGAWRQTARVRRLVSANLATATIAGGGGRLIQESFAPIYEDAGDRWIDEAAPVRVARYNRAVLDAEAAAERVTREGGAGVVLRFAYFYGADSDFTRDGVRSVRHGRAPVFGSPAAYISSVSHDDAAAAVVAALGVPAGRYNVSDDRPMQRRDFADALAAALGVGPPKFFPGWVAALAGSLVRLSEHLQPRPTEAVVHPQCETTCSLGLVQAGRALLVKRHRAATGEDVRRHTDAGRILSPESGAIEESIQQHAGLGAVGPQAVLHPGDIRFDAEVSLHLLGDRAAEQHPGLEVDRPGVVQVP
jgi:nucleoside-diphosphate-sugar epimerase